MALAGEFRTVATHEVATTDEARKLVETHAASGGYMRVKTADDGDGSLRFTATTPGGRAGRNVAFLDYGYPGDAENA